MFSVDLRLGKCNCLWLEGLDQVSRQLFVLRCIQEEVFDDNKMLFVYQVLDIDALFIFEFRSEDVRVLWNEGACEHPIGFSIWEVCSFGDFCYL